MSAGTLTLTNNSATVSGAGTTFTTDLAAGDFIVVTVGGVPYTLPIKVVNSNTSLTLVSNYTGPTQSGAAWSAVPRVALNMVTAALVAQSAEALRGLNYDKQNWQSVFAGTGNITVRLPDGSTFTGPSWKYLADNMATKTDGAVPVEQGGTGAKTAQSARPALGVGEWGPAPISEGVTGPWGTVSNNNLKLPAGIYQGTASNWGSPPGSGPTQGFKLINLSSAENWVPQMGLVDSSTGGALWLRSIYNGALTDWDRVPTASLIGFGTETPQQGPLANNSATLRPAMYYAQGSNIGTPAGNSTGGFGVLQFSGNSVAYRCQLATQDGGGGRLFIRATNASSWGSWMEFYHTGNTTKASDGTLKAASPVARIVKSEDETVRTDVAEDGFAWCGSGTANAEAEGITISRLDVGVYVLTGSAGLASEGWQLLPPMDPGGMGELGVVEAEQTESGGLTIRLFKRKYMLSDGGEIEKTKGEPIDVPANSWIDVRLDMPESSIWNQKQAEAQEVADLQESSGS